MEKKFDGRQNLRPQNTRPPEERRRIAAMGARACNAKKKERQAIADALRAVLDEPLNPDTGTTRLQGIAVKVIKKIFDDPDVRDVKVLAEILGELRQVVDTAGIQLNITASPTGQDNIGRLMEDE